MERKRERLPIAIALFGLLGLIFMIAAVVMGLTGKMGLIPVFFVLGIICLGISGILGRKYTKPKGG